MKVNQLKAGVILSYLSMGLGYLIAFIYTPIMLRLLGKNEYGLYNLATSVVSFLGVLNFGFGSTYTRFYLRYKATKNDEEIAKLNGLFLLIFLFIGVITIIASGVMVKHSQTVFGRQLTSQEQQTAKNLLIILSVNLAISFPGIVFSSHITANEQFVFLKLINMFSLIFSPFISIILLLLGYGSIGLAIASTVVRLLIEICNISYCFRKLKMRFSFSGFEPGLLGSVTRFSFFIFINIVIDQVNWNIDKLILGRIHGTAAVALYGVAAQINTYYISIASTMSSVFIPRVHKIIADNQGKHTLESLFVRIGRIQFAVLSLLSMGMFFFGKPFFVLWAGKEYADSYYIVLLLLVPVTIPLIQNIGIEIQRAYNLHKFRSFVYFGIALLNVIITFLLVPKFQGIGAAIGTAVSILLGNGIIMNIYNHNKVGLNMLRFWKQICAMSVGLIFPLIIGVLIAKFISIESWTQLMGLGLFFILVYIVSMWRFGFNTYEKNLIYSPIRKLLWMINRKDN